MDGFIRVYDGIRYLVLFVPEKHVAIYSRIRYLISQKVTLRMCFSHNCEKIKIDSYSFPLETMMTSRNIIILIRSVFNKDRSNNYYSIVLEKYSYK